MAFDLSDVLWYLAEFGIFFAIIGVFVWFVVSLVRYARYHGDDAMRRQRLRFWMMLSGGLWLLSILCIVALVILFMMAIAHM